MHVNVVAHIQRYNTYRARSTYQKFADSWAQYHKCFIKWKRHDAAKLEGLLIAHYVELDALRHTVAVNTATEREWCPHIDLQQQQITASLKQLGGAKALARLQEAVEASARYGLFVVSMRAGRAGCNGVDHPILSGKRTMWR